jgi:hypothetical protein
MHFHLHRVSFGGLLCTTTLFCKCPHNILCYLFKFICAGFLQRYQRHSQSEPFRLETPLSAALKVNADYQMTAKSHILATPLLVLHFILSSIRPNGNPARFMGDSMGEYLPDGCFRYEEVSFDLTTDAQAALHGNQMNRLVKELQQ